jgi:hypothetical protein
LPVVIATGWGLTVGLLPNMRHLMCEGGQDFLVRASGEAVGV